MISDLIEMFWSYKPDKDTSPTAEPSDLFSEFGDRDVSMYKASISTFASVASCPYRIVNIGMGHKPMFSKIAIRRMNKGSKAHRRVEREVNLKAERSIAKGGPPDWKRVPKSMAAVADQELLEAPEVRVSLTAGGLDLRGKADGLLRSSGIVVAVERKPRTRVFQPASTLQAMSYAIGGCLSLGSENASQGAKWLVSDYGGSINREGDITESVCDLVKGLGRTYVKLLGLGEQNKNIPELPGPKAGKCARCEFQENCRFRVESTPHELEAATEPVWVKYARRGSKRNKLD